MPAVNKDKHVMKRYKCNYCSKIFSNEGNRIRHQDYFCKDKQKATICPVPEKELKRCDEAESRSGGSANSKLRKISDQFILSTDQSLAKHLNNNTNFYSRMILAMSLKVSVNGFWPIAFVNKNSTLYTKLSPYCAISNGNEELNSIISDSFESDNNGKFVDIPKSLKLSTGDETVDVSGYLRPKKEKWFQVKERAESYRVYSKVLFTASSMAPSVPKTAVSSTIQKSSNLDAMDITVDCCDRDGNVKEFVEKIQNVLNDISKERIATHVPVSVQLIFSSAFQSHDAAILQQIGFFRIQIKGLVHCQQDVKIPSYKQLLFHLHCHIPMLLDLHLLNS